MRRSDFLTFAGASTNTVPANTLTDIVIEQMTQDELLAFVRRGIAEYEAKAADIKAKTGAYIGENRKIAGPPVDVAIMDKLYGIDFIITFLKDTESRIVKSGDEPK